MLDVDTDQLDPRVVQSVHYVVNFGVKHRVFYGILSIVSYCVVL